MIGLFFCCFFFVVFLFVFFFWGGGLKNKLWVHPQSFFEQKSVKESIPLSEPQSFFIKFGIYERVFNDKNVLQKYCHQI